MTKVLDHGYVELVTSWGSDEDIIRAARMSTDAGFRGWGSAEAPGDEKLLGYLWRNGHHTPFEMAGASFEMQMPIFVARELMRHRGSSFNELSSRYTPVPDVNYIPSIERLMINASGTNKQAGTVSDARPLTLEAARAFRKKLEDQYREFEADYQWALSAGVPKELARVGMPVGRYTRLRMQCNLRMWTHFLGLRQADNAQYEIRMFANAIADLLTPLFPHTMGLFAGS